MKMIQIATLASILAATSVSAFAQDSNPAAGIPAPTVNTEGTQVREERGEYLKARGAHDPKLVGQERKDYYGSEHKFDNDRRARWAKARRARAHHSHSAKSETPTAK